MELQILCWPQHQRLHSSEILEWRDYLGACCKRTIIKNNELRFSSLIRSMFMTRLYLLVKRKSSKALASSGHIVSNFPEEACCRATGNPMDSTLSRDETASFQVLSDGQAYFKPSGIFKVWKEIKRENKNCWVTKSTFTIGFLQRNTGTLDVTDLYRPICALTNLVETDPSPLYWVLSCSVLIFWVWIGYRQKVLSAVCASVPGRFKCRVYLLCWIYWWFTDTLLRWHDNKYYCR